MKPIIEIDHLSKSYTISHLQKAGWTLRDELGSRLRGRSPHGLFKRGKREKIWALKDVSLDVIPGDILGIVGKNGSGKSTLLKILSRIVDPTEGSAVLRGRVASLLEVGTGFHPELSGRENIFFNGAILGMRKREIQQKFDQIVDFSGIEKFIDTPVKFYSSGMYVRLAFAVAAHLESEILIVDEVLAVGDAEFQKKSLSKMREVTLNQGRTVLFVSHNAGAIRALCTKGALLDEGRLRKQGPIGDVLEEYLSKGLLEGGKAVFEPKRDQDLFISSLQIRRRGESRGTTRLKFQEPFEIEVEVEARKPHKAILGVGIANDSYESMMTLHTHEIGEAESEKIRNLTSLNKGKNRFRLVIPSNPLRPGPYHLSASLFDRKNAKSFDVVDYGLTFEVGHEGADRYFDERQQGRFFLTDTYWEV